MNTSSLGSPATASDAPGRNRRSGCCLELAASASRRACTWWRRRDVADGRPVNHACSRACAAVRRCLGFGSKRPRSKSFASSEIHSHGSSSDDASESDAFFSSSFPDVPFVVLKMSRSRSHSMIWSMSASSSSSSKGHVPVSSACMATPSAHTSTPRPYCPATSASGATYANVPHTFSARSRAVSALANPKSTSVTLLTSPGRASTRFSSLRSRCTTRARA